MEVQPIRKTIEKSTIRRYYLYNIKIKPTKVIQIKTYLNIGAQRRIIENVYI